MILNLPGWNEANFRPDGTHVDKLQKCKKNQLHCANDCTFVETEKGMYPELARARSTSQMTLSGTYVSCQ